MIGQPSSVSIVHLYLFRSLINVSREENYVDTSQMLYAMKKSLFHNTPRIFYRELMGEMEERGFVRLVNKQRYLIIKSKKNLKMLKGIRENVFPISLFS